MGLGNAAPQPANDFVYQLQKIDLRAIGETKFDLVIIDYSRDGSDARRFTASQISALKESPGGPKRVLAYMSIGEAEDYRWYWRRSWDANGDGKPDDAAPPLARTLEPRLAWQRIVYDYLDKILPAGYDGVYPDIVDAYEYWGPGGPSGLDHPTAERGMMCFVKSIAEYARETWGAHPGFEVFVQKRRGPLGPFRLRAGRQRHR
jgi:cysteinyl-tRNA synthetase